MKNIISVFVSVFLCLATSASAQEHFLEIIKAEQVKDTGVIRSFGRGDSVPGMMVNEDKDVKVGRKLKVGDFVSVPKDIRVTFESSNKNTIETKNNAEFIVSNITDKGESYYQKFGKIRYGVFHKAIEFFKVSHAKYLAAVEGTVFEVNIDLEKKEIEFTAEEGDVRIIREYYEKFGEKEIRREEHKMISSRYEKLRRLKYVLEFDEIKFKSYKEAVETYLKEYEMERKSISTPIPDSSRENNDRNCNLFQFLQYELYGDSSVKEQLYEEAIKFYQDALRCGKIGNFSTEHIKQKIEEVKKKMK